jgi:hypothetical protein
MLFIIGKVWAADDFEIFKRMMIQKNIELQLQALELLQQRSQSTYSTCCNVHTEP